MARVEDRGPLVLHGWWSLGSRLRLWGEGAARLGRRTAPPRSMRTGAPRVPAHRSPFRLEGSATHSGGRGRGRGLPSGAAMDVPILVGTDRAPRIVQGP